MAEKLNWTHFALAAINLAFVATVLWLVSPYIDPIATCLGHR